MKEQVGNVHRFGKYFLLENSIGGLTFLSDEQFRILSLYAKSKSVSCTCEKIIAIYNISVEKQEIVRENVKRFIENCDRKGLVYKDFYLTGEFNKYYPRFVNIELTNCCNFFCSHCYKKAETTNTTFLDKTFIIKFCQQYSKKSQLLI